MNEEQHPAEHRRIGIGEGIRQGIGVLTAFKEALEETIQEAVDRGDLRPERAKEALSGALLRAQEAVGDVRERLDFAHRRELEELRAEVAELRRRVTLLEGRALPAPASSAVEPATDELMP